LVRRTFTQRSKAYSWSVDENCALIAKAKGEAPIGQQAALATINQFLQPQMNEMFFAQYVIFVEGDENRSIIDRYLQLSGRSADLLAVGVHIVLTNGKGNMMNALSVARGLEIPYFAVFDADMNRNSTDNASLNKNILAVMAYDGAGKDGSITAHVFGDNLCIWKDCLQSAISDDVAGWEVEKAKVCGEFGWTIDRLRKNRMVLEATLDRTFKKQKISALETLCSAIAEKFAKIPSA
jgi:putative ATP-dependent endonuclease of OLD family